MIFIVLVIIGFIGIIATTWLSSASLRYAENPVARGDEWFSLSPEAIERNVAAKFRQEFRRALKILLIWMIALYRKLSEKITIKQTVKKHVRGFLYDHAPNGERKPSEFWHKVRKPRAPRASAKKHPVQDIADVTSEENSDTVSE